MRRPSLVLASVAVVFACGAPVAAAGPTEEGKRFLEERHFRSAAAAFRRALKASSGDTEAIYGFARTVSDLEVARSAIEGGFSADDFQEVEALLRDRLKASPTDKRARLALGDLFLAWSFLDGRYRADAQDQFRRVATADPADGDAVVGLAKIEWLSGHPEEGIKALDAFLEKHPTSATALFGKGWILYTEGRVAFQAEQLSARTKDLFQKAAGALDASVKAGASNKAAWLHVAYASQYLSGADPTRRETAAEAYEKALALDPDDLAPVRGVASLTAGKPDLAAAVAARLSTAFPKAPSVAWLRAEVARAAGRLDEAEKAMREHVAASKSPGTSLGLLGDLLEKKGDAAGALDAFRRSLEAEPTIWRAEALATKVLGAINAKAEEAWDDVGRAHKLLGEYRALAALVPTNKAVRNDGGFFCREAYAKTGKKDAGLLKGSVELYEAASALIPEWREEYVDSYPYPERHQYAQILNDTGLMFQYEPAILNLGTAEKYYRRAMEWTQHGYWDTFGNLLKLLKAQGRVPEAYEFAAACAEGIKKEDGSPNEAFRGTCAAERDRLQKQLPDAGK